MTPEEIEALPKIQRLAGYLARMAAVDEFGARLRSIKKDEEWTTEEDEEWDELAEATEHWWYALSQDEKNLLNPILIWTACLCRGEDPEEHYELIIKTTKNGKYKIHYEKRYWDLVKKCAVELFNYHENLDERINELMKLGSEMVYHDEPLYVAANFAGMSIQDFNKIDKEIYDKYFIMRDYNETLH